MDHWTVGHLLEYKFLPSFGTDVIRSSSEVQHHFAKMNFISFQGKLIKTYILLS